MNHSQKKPNNYFCLLVFFLLGTITMVVHAETQVSISVSDNLAYIGDRIKLKVLVKTTEDIDQITVKPDSKEFEILAQGETTKRKQQDYTVFEKDVQVTFFKTGNFNVGPFTVELLKAKKPLEIKTTNAVPVTIKTTLTDADKDIKPIKGPVEIKGNPFYILKYVFFALGIIILTLILLWWWRKRKAARPMPTESLLTPLEELETRIKDLGTKGYMEKGKPKHHFLELTRILKHFLLRTYRFNAEDYTTYETMFMLMQKETAATIVDNMRFLFNTADLVKFAMFIPDAVVLAELDGKIADMVVTYKQRLLTPEPEAKAEGVQ